MLRLNSVDRREETSNWIKDLDENDEHRFMCHTDHMDDIVNSRLRVRILPNTFTPTEFICQRLDLLNKYEDQQKLMNDFYTNYRLNNVSSASSTTTDNQSKRKMSANSLCDSLNSYASNETNDLLVQPFRNGDYCAAQLNKSWTRCKILDIMNKVAFIECVDDGRQHRCALNKLETLDGRFRVLPKFALKCKLAQLNDSIKLLALDLNAINKFKQLISQENKEFIADVIESKTDEHNNQIFELELFINEKNIIEMLTK